jgi:hypothetical protein
MRIPFSPTFVLACVFSDSHSNKTEVVLICTSTTLITHIYPQECKSEYNKDTCTECLLQHCSQYPSYENNPDVLQLMKKIVCVCVCVCVCVREREREREREKYRERETEEERGGSFI